MNEKIWREKKKKKLPGYPQVMSDKRKAPSAKKENPVSSDHESSDSSDEAYLLRKIPKLTSQIAYKTKK